MFRRENLAFLLGAAVVLLSSAWAWGAPPTKPIEARGAIEAVTVYRGQALVTRVVELAAPAGAVDLVVTDLPAQILPDSLFASADGQVSIRAVRYRARAVQDEPRDEVRKLQADIEEVHKALRENQALLKVLADKEAYLASLEKFSAEKAKDDMAKGVLNVDALKGVAEFVFQQRSGLGGEGLQLRESQKKLQERLALLERQLGELAGRLARSAREAVLFIDKPGPAKATVRLHYLVSSASWGPMYNLRVGPDRKQVGLEYNALVQQMSGEDWDGVQLTLSTASPTMLAEAPILTPLWVSLTGQPPQDAKSAAVVVGGQRAAGERLRKALEARHQRATGDLDKDWDVNVAANTLQMMDLTAGKDALLAGREVRPIEEALSVNYVLPGRISLPSRSDQQMIQIASLKLTGEFYYLGVPVLTPYVYQHADVVNTSELALLSGPVSAYLDGQFMGSGRIPMVAKGQKFNVGFGVDTQLRVSRELADKTDRVQGGNREMVFTYRLLIENYKDKEVKVRLMDRMPDPKGADIRVTLGKISDPLVDNKVYQRTLQKMGILMWDIAVPAKAADASARIVEYDYKVDFDKNMYIGEPSALEVEPAKMEFERARSMMLSQ